MTCKTFRKYLYAFADGELETRENLEALEHLNMCPSCCRKVAVQQALRGREVPLEALRLHVRRERTAVRRKNDLARCIPATIPLVVD